MPAPRRQIPQAIVAGGIVIAAIYLFSAFGIGAAVPTRDISVDSGLIDAVSLMTGTTGGAGICISASATRNGLSLIAVILGAPSSADRFDAATTLLDYGFGAYEAAPLPKLEAQPLQITVKGSAAGSVPLDYSALPETVLVEKGSGASLHTELTLPEELEAPVELGQTLGKAAVYQGEALLEEHEVRAAADAPRMTVRDAIGLLWQSLTGAA